MPYSNNFQWFTFLLLKRKRLQKLVFEDGGVPKHQQNKNLPDTNVSQRTGVVMLPLYNKKRKSDT